MTTPRLVAPVVAATALVLAPVAVALGLPPFSTERKSAGAAGDQAELFAVAVGCHAKFDRFVIRARFGTPGYVVRYARRIVEDGSGRPVRLRGTKRIRVTIRRARAHTEAGARLLPPVLTPLCPNLRQVKDAGDFEGIASFGLGLRRKTGFRVFRLSNPTRVVIDVSH
jgi:hypothetical protein